MNIVRIENIKGCLATTYSLTLNVEKYKDLHKDCTLVILSEEDIEDEHTIIKLKGINISILMLPKKYKFIFDETKYYKHLVTQLSEDYKITYY